MLLGNSNLQDQDLDEDLDEEKNDEQDEEEDDEEEEEGEEEEGEEGEDNKVGDEEEGDEEEGDEEEEDEEEGDEEEGDEEEEDEENDLEKTDTNKKLPLKEEAGKPEVEDQILCKEQNSFLVSESEQRLTDSPRGNKSECRICGSILAQVSSHTDITVRSISQQAMTFDHNLTY